MLSITYKWPQHDVCVRGTTPWLFRILDANAITLWCGSWIDLVLYSGCDSLHFILLLINVFDFANYSWKITAHGGKPTELEGR